MKLVLNEELQFLKDTASNFAKDKAPVSHLRKLRDEDHPNSWDEGLWNEMVELGWTSILIPEKYGGSEFGLAGISVVLQELGKTLVPSPLFATGVLGVTSINQMGSESQKEELLGKILEGKLTTALAIDEGSHHEPANTELTAEKNNDGWVLNGEKVFVIDGSSADLLIVIARTSGNKGDAQGLSAFIVDPNSKGINRRKVPTADSRNYANISFEDVTISAEEILGEALCNIEQPKCFVKSS